MDPASLASAFVGTQLSSTQLALVAEMLRISAAQEQAVAQLVQAGSQNLSQLAAGIGGNLNISV
jgi:hypothetical protein